MRLFASDGVKNMMRSLGMEKGESIEHRMVTGAIEKAQKKVEGRNYDMRKNLLEYDDVANDQLHVNYQQRNDIEDFKKEETLTIPYDTDYTKVGSLSNEVVEKLSGIRPPTLGAASRISGVTPAAIIALLRFVKKLKNNKVA